MSGHYDEGYKHEVSVTEDHEGAAQYRSVAQCTVDGCGWAGTEFTGGQGAWDKANNEGYQHVCGSHPDHESDHNDSGFHVYTEDAA